VTPEERTARVLEKVAAERRRQNELLAKGKFPWNCASEGPSHADKFAVLAEEVGEVAREVNEYAICVGTYAADELKVMPPHREKQFRDQLASELVQVAACCVGWAECLVDPETEAQPQLESKAVGAKGEREYLVRLSRAGGAQTPSPERVLATSIEGALVAYYQSYTPRDGVCKLEVILYEDAYSWSRDATYQEFQVNPQGVVEAPTQDSTVS
jgi:NTP pyrophosphatase (non-canonical NTP hydrolase)